MFIIYFYYINKIVYRIQSAINDGIFKVLAGNYKSFTFIKYWRNNQNLFLFKK